jgi:hypothetical protein
MDDKSIELLTELSEGMFIPVKGALHGGQVTVPQMRRHSLQLLYVGSQ